ncbi:putative Teichoic acid poly(glycerol phosphate) polymerase [Oenococcus oeni]|uniref:CDP-glycerol glycerophosphotransferase family protein n=1 Tax=Oenococcus oeni TaxID=1247 RepID=UPI0010B19C37|nr:CDP-glycerol glycerophosphotransferase family protein [Oenococcus oeni]SYW05552.1 putative Teichoic acid poly(glycerol phosphate) polymerase [Oenococcus oeni]
MKSKIKNSVFLSFIYIHLITVFTKLMSLFVKQDGKLIVFASFSGRQISDSPLAIYNIIRNDPSFKDYRLVWLISRSLNKNADQLGIVHARFGGLKHWYWLIKAKYWVSNSSIDRFVPIKFKNTVYFNTWHGTPWKIIGPEEKNISPLVRNWYKKVCFDYLTLNGEYDCSVFKNVFPNTKDYLKIGLPRNYLLKKTVKSTEIKSFFEKYNLDNNKKTVLYAPTFRDYSVANDLAYLSKKELELIADKYNLLIRSHYNDSFKSSKKFHNVSAENINILFHIADFMISDYSSIMFDFAITNKPVISIAKDFDLYSRNRGFFFDEKKMPFPILKKFEFNAIQKQFSIAPKNVENFIGFLNPKLGVKKIKSILSGKSFKKRSN